MIEQYTITNKYNFPQSTIDSILPQRFFEQSIHSLKQIQNRPLQLNQEIQQLNSAEQYPPNLQLKPTPITLKPDRQETLVAAVDTSTIKIGETQTPKPTQPPTYSPSSTPTTQPSPNSTLSTPQPEQYEEPPNPTTPQDPLNSPLLYVHPPLAIIGYVLTFAFAVLVLMKKSVKGRTTKITGIALWLFMFLGLLSGMLWAQLAFGNYWSWDPKETMTLALFLTVSAGQFFYFEKKYATAKWVALLSCALVIVTGLSSFIIFGLQLNA